MEDKERLKRKIVLNWTLVQQSMIDDILMAKEDNMINQIERLYNYYKIKYESGWLDADCYIVLRDAIRFSEVLKPFQLFNV